RAARRPLKDRVGELAREARTELQRRGQDAVARFVRGATDAQLERRFGNQLALRAIFTGMTRQFDPKLARGFEGDILYELEHHVDGGAARPPDRWTVRVRGEKATAAPEGSAEPAVTLRVAIPDFARLIADEVHVTKLLLEGRFQVEGDFQVAARLSEMFGGPSQY